MNRPPWAVTVRPAGEKVILEFSRLDGQRVDVIYLALERAALDRLGEQAAAILGKPWGEVKCQ